MSDNQQPKNKPEVIRDGRLKANIWTNKGENDSYHNIDFARTYVDNDGNYKDTNSLGQNDLLPLAELARETYRRVNELKREHRQSQNQEQSKSQNDTPREKFKEKRSAQNKNTEPQRQQ